MSIVTLAYYRRITKDSDSYDGDVITALSSAQRFIEDHTNRYFDYADEDDTPIVRTESLNVHGDGRVYPHAAPVVAVSLPVSAEVSDGSIFWPGDWTSALASSEWPFQPSYMPPDSLLATVGRSGRPKLLVTYTGGWTASSAPESLKRLICAVAKADLMTSLRIQVPVGATSVTSGDISYSGTNLGQDYDTPIWAGINRWKRREV